jgi:heme o synthase
MAATQENLFKAYYTLTKPGIIYGNMLTATGGFLFASRGIIDLGRLIATLLGIAFVIASACVFNNYVDRQIDQKMARTKKRALASGRISPKAALIYGTILGVIGFTALIAFTNLSVVLIGVVGFVSYLVLYGIGKRHSIHGTLVGSISGATPPVAGYVAVTGNFDTIALLLFVILVLWQMPHFYAIAMYRQDDYTAASIPVMPVKKGIEFTKLQIVCYIATFIVATSLLSVLGYAGFVYLLVMVSLGAAWLMLGLKGLQTEDSKMWARKMFFFSLIVITGFSFMIAIDTWLP